MGFFPVTRYPLLVTSYSMSPLIKWTPFLDQFEDLEKFVDQTMGLGSGIRAQHFAPPIDIYETKDAVVVESPLAGIDPEKVDISIENDVLIMRGQSEKKSEVEDKNYYRREVRAGSFYRSVPLPTHVIGEKASAVYEKGVLKVSVPKAPERKAKTVKVQIKGKK